MSGSGRSARNGPALGRQASERQFERYLQGPADLVWEVLLPGHERQDREVKFHAYEGAGVDHYWIIDPEAETVDFFHLIRGQYGRESPEDDGRCRSAGIPGLAFVPNLLWRESISSDAKVFEVEASLPPDWSRQAQKGIGWDDVPFVPRPQLESRLLHFEQFASWCPRAKFEGDGQRTTIESQRGTRNVLGMLLRGFGLAETVTLFAAPGTFFRFRPSRPHLPGLAGFIPVTRARLS